MKKVKLILYAWSWIIKAKIIQLITNDYNILQALDDKMNEIEDKLNYYEI